MTPLKIGTGTQSIGLPQVLILDQDQLNFGQSIHMFVHHIQSEEIYINQWRMEKFLPCIGTAQ